MASSALPRDAAENSQSLWLFQSRKPRARIWGLVDSCCWDKRGLGAGSLGLGEVWDFPLPSPCPPSPPTLLLLFLLILLLILLLLLLLLLLGHGDGEPLFVELAKDS